MIVKMFLSTNIYFEIFLEIKKILDFFHFFFVFLEGCVLQSDFSNRMDYGEETDDLRSSFTTYLAEGDKV